MHKIIFILLSLFATNSFAAELADLYQSQAVVANQDDQERQRVSPDILRQVLLKVVGDSAALNAANLTPILANVDALVERAEYQQLQETLDDATPANQLALSLTFNESAVNQVLTNNGLPIWSKMRPDVMVWLAIDDGHTKHIVASDDETQYKKVVEQAAVQRGLPILLPIMDLQDQIQISIDDISAGLAAPIQQASQRYGAKIILLAQLTHLADDDVKIDWQSLIDGGIASEQWQTKGKIGAALQAGIDQFTDKVSRDFTQVVTDQEQNTTSTISTLEIANVRDYADYSRAMTYLGRLQYVSDLQMVSMENETLAVTLQIKGDKSVFVRTLAIEHVIAKEGDNADDVMRYRLLP